MSPSKLFTAAAGGQLATVITVSTVHDIAVIVAGLATIFSAAAALATRKPKRKGGEK